MGLLADMVPLATVLMVPMAITRLMATSCELIKFRVKCLILLHSRMGWEIEGGERGRERFKGGGG